MQQVIKSDTPIELDFPHVKTPHMEMRELKNRIEQLEGIVMTCKNQMTDNGTANPFVIQAIDKLIPNQLINNVYIKL